MFHSLCKIYSFFHSVQVPQIFLKTCNRSVRAICAPSAESRCSNFFIYTLKILEASDPRHINWPDKTQKWNKLQMACNNVVNRESSFWELEWQLWWAPWDDFFADIFRNSIFKSIMATTQKYFLKENILLSVNLTIKGPMFDDQDIRI